MEKFNIGDMFKTEIPKKEENDGKEEVRVEKPVVKLNKTLEEVGTKVSDKVQETVARNRALRADDDFQAIDKENKEAMKGSGVIAVLGPLLGMIGGPMFAIFNMGLDNDAIMLLGSVILGNLIGNLIGGGISWANLRNTVNNRTKMTYLYVQNIVGSIKNKSDIDKVKLEQLQAENATLKTENAMMKDELTAYKIKEQAEELAKKMNSEVRGGPHERR